MKELIILSGKGGTGKTSITSAFASLAGNMVLCDADVDAADLHLIMNPEKISKNEFVGGNEASINPDKCIQCGQCEQLCRFDAVVVDPETQEYSIDPVACEGCGVCVALCPENAIDFPQCVCGEWYISETRFGPMVHARLGIAQENSGKLVSLVRQEAKKIAEEKGIPLVLTDGPPGVGCPVIACMGQASAVLIIAEPTVSGTHDMQRVIELADHFKLPAMVCINKYDINPDQSDKLQAIAESLDVPVVGKIPFDPVFTKAMIKAETVLEYDPDAAISQEIRNVWKTVAHRLENQKTPVRLL